MRILLVEDDKVLADALTRALVQAAHEAMGGKPGSRPLVVDPFAGGGAIPLEAIRGQLEQWLSEERSAGGFLRGGVTFGADKTKVTDFQARLAIPSEGLLLRVGARKIVRLIVS